MLPCFLRQILTLPSEYCSRNRDSSDQPTFFQSSIVQFWWACANCSLHLLQGSTCCVFRDGFLHTLVVTSGYLSYYCRSIIFNQSAHSTLTSDINKAFTSLKIPVDQQFLKYSDQPVCHQQTFHVQSHLNPLSSQFWCSVWTSSCLHHI